MPFGGAKRLLAIDTGAEGREFMSRERLMNPLCPLLGRRDVGNKGLGVIDQPSVIPMAELSIDKLVGLDLVGAEGIGKGVSVTDLVLV